jgi:hypothetical protein
VFSDTILVLFFIIQYDTVQQSMWTGRGLRNPILHSNLTAKVPNPGIINYHMCVMVASTFFDLSFTRRLIIVFNGARHLTISWARWIQSTPYFFKIHFIIFLPCTYVSPNCSLPFRFSDYVVRNFFFAFSGNSIKYVCEGQRAEVPYRAPTPNGL